MKRLIASLILIAFSTTVSAAQLPAGFEPVEKSLIEQQLQQDVTKDLDKEAAPKTVEKSSNWWKWALGILVVGGIAAAAGGGGGGGSTPSPSGTTPTSGSGTVTW